MFKLWFLLLFSLHLLGAFYLRSRRYPYLVYAAILFSAVLVRPTLVMLGACALVITAFIVTQRAQTALQDSLQSEGKSALIRHLSVLAFIILAAFVLWQNSSPPHWLQRSHVTMLKLGAMLLFAGRPSSDIIRHVLRVFERSEENIVPAESLLHGGKTIGILERVLVALLLFSGQWTAVGFVFTAKGIIRWKNISKDNTEYFLIGTLLSLLCVIGIYLFIF